MNRSFGIVVIVASAALIGGCGGGDDEPESVATTTVAPAADSAAGAAPATTSTVVDVPVTEAPVDATLSVEATISTAGLGPIAIGATVGAAEAAVGTTFVPAVASADGSCVEHAVPGLDGVGVVAIDGEVAVVEVSTPIVATPSGVIVGDPADRAPELFGERIETTQAGTDVVHTYVPVDADDQQFRVVFVTDGSVIYRIRAGRIPEVTTLLGCSG